MKHTKFAIGLIATALLVAGCGTAKPTANQTSNQTTSPKSTTKQTVIRQGNNMLVGAGSYAGQANLKKYESTAKQSPQNAQAQINAGISAYDNGQYQTAVAYYKKAIQLDPKNAIPYNNLGNTYLRGLKQPKNALPYYQKATQVQPSYAYGWYNLALCQEQLGDNTAAKATFQSALKVVPKSDPLYSVMQKAMAQVK